MKIDVVAMLLCPCGPKAQGTNRAPVCLTSVSDAQWVDRLYPLSELCERERLCMGPGEATVTWPLAGPLAKSCHSSETALGSHTSGVQRAVDRTAPP